MGMAAQTKPEAGGPPGVPLGGLRVNAMWFCCGLGPLVFAVDLALEHGGAAEAQEGHDGYAGHDVEASAAGARKGTLLIIFNSKLQNTCTQFSAVYCERKLPETVVNIEKYLASGAVKGIGPGLAKKIVDVFGDRTLDIMENAPFRLAEIKGISPKKCEEIAAEAQKLFCLRNLMSFLSQYEVKSRFAMNTYRKFGSDAMTLLKLNPYLLCGDAIELDFGKADTIAHDMHIARNDSKRIIAGVQYILRANAGIGHTCLPLEVLAKKTQDTLGVSESDFYSAYNAALEDNELFEYIKGEIEFVYLPDYFYAESFIADRYTF